MSLQFEPKFFKVEKMEVDVPIGTVIKKPFNLYDSDDEDVKTEVKHSPPEIKLSASTTNISANSTYKDRYIYENRFL